MSGTSLDGVDAALLETDGGTYIVQKESFFLPYSSDFREKLKAVASGDMPLSDVLRLERELTEYHCQAVEGLLSKTSSKPDVIGFHGQTIRHLPEEGLTWQLGDANYLAERVGIPVVADFRRRDTAAGGEGAPLAPLFHQALFEKQPKPCAVVNIGGVANMTYLAEDGSITAGDCGPGSGLLDAWMQSQTGEPFDEDGNLSAQGDIVEGELNQALELPFFRKPFPKSADRYDFNAVDMTGLSVQDGAATLTAITAEGILRCLPGGKTVVWLTGGGSKNKALVAYLEKMGVSAKPVDSIGLDGDMLEAECFAWLAVRRLKNLNTSLPETTGCQRATCGGVLTS